MCGQMEDEIPLKSSWLTTKLYIYSYISYDTETQDELWNLSGELFSEQGHPQVQNKMVFFFYPSLYCSCELQFVLRFTPP